MRALLIAAHGSRRSESNDEVRQLAAALSPLVADRYGYVGPAFLELADPSIDEAIDEAVGRGAREVVVLPYFLAAGTHVARDVPQIVRDRQRAHPNVHIRLADHLGTRPEMLDLLARVV
jgi:sirohydrochlorin ferrochelatase